MKFSPASALVASLALSALTLPAHAIDMLGDTLKIERSYPNVDAVYQPTVFTTVVAGLADAVNAGDTYLLLNPEANRIEFDFQTSSAFGGDGSIFDGFRIGGFSHTINALSIAQVNGLTVVSLGLDTSNRIELNLAGPFTADSTLVLQVGFVPEPQTYALLLAGLGGVWLWLPGGGP